MQRLLDIAEETLGGAIAPTLGTIPRNVKTIQLGM